MSRIDMPLSSKDRSTILLYHASYQIGQDWDTYCSFWYVPERRKRRLRTVATLLAKQDYYTMYTLLHGGEAQVRL